MSILCALNDTLTAAFGDTIRSISGPKSSGGSLARVRNGLSFGDVPPNVFPPPLPRWFLESAGYEQNEEGVDVCVGEEYRVL